MAHVFQVPDEIYEKLASYAAEKGQTPEEILLEWMAEPEAYIKAQPTIAAPELSPEEIFLRLSGIFKTPVEAGWADNHDYYYAGGEFDDSEE